MSLSVAEAVRRLGERADEDAGLAETLRYLAEDDAGPDDPFARQAESLLAAARTVSDRRRQARLQARQAAALDTGQVVNVLSSVHDRKGVDRRRRRGQLLGWRSGARTLHPAWQFDPSRGDTRQGLSGLIEALRAVTPDAQAADALMTAAREDLDGRSLADLFAEGHVETVKRLVLATADQS